MTVLIRWNMVGSDAGWLFLGEMFVHELASCEILYREGLDLTNPNTESSLLFILCLSIGNLRSCFTVVCDS